MPGHPRGWRTVWRTGLPSSGRSAAAAAPAPGLPGPAQVLDGDVPRRDLFPGPGFWRTRPERERSAGRGAGDDAARHGVIVLVRDRAVPGSPRGGARRPRGGRDRLPGSVGGPPLEVCVRRDVKGPYAKANAGRITGMSG
ncbi:adenylyl-sulfate kinase [Streptomyces albipurpureus]|uniref:adenylyl-sulfate kinase n=1 Tax=Streptomyces albipurpureus TaxID=2897419 RepID=UPI003CE49CD5